MPDEAIREAARAEMQRRNLSARALARTLGITKEAVLDFIHGRRRTQAAVRTLICRELGLDSVKTQSAA
ncbi:hypothetical protein [Deinococcus enclensis]|uniref:Transcriptional regulator n=1 Tax=Deinococcus enclensis TaxID=1049582 RepID=A0ABT9MFD9_9DEIO|nr:hypothetical protein [Deinococcus enclensis]MDP9764909.1 putative transcriptional regulator [Deinococcus enclensis]